MAEYNGYTFLECTDMICTYVEMGYNTNAARRSYRERYPDRRIPCAKMFVTLLQRLRDIGTFIPRKNDAGVQRTRRTVDMEEEVLDKITENPCTSTRAIATDMNQHHMTVFRVLKGEKMHPFHVQRVQELNPADFEPRTVYCRWFLERCINNPDFPRKILFTDEATFTREGMFNCHNNHVWHDQNPHATRSRGHQRKFNVNVWAGILDGRLIGPHFLPPTLNGAEYLHFLQIELPELLEDIPLNIREQMWFQQDGAPAHYSRNVREYLNNTFGNRWIARGGPVSWPARSPDLTPLDFSIWGIFKDLVYKTPVESIEDVKARILVIAEDLAAMPETFNNIYRNIILRCNTCVEVNGQQFEQYLH